jgi:hypothetical protein
MNSTQGTCNSIQKVMSKMIMLSLLLSGSYRTTCTTTLAFTATKSTSSRTMSSKISNSAIAMNAKNAFEKGDKGKILVLGGSGKFDQIYPKCLFATVISIIVFIFIMLWTHHAWYWYLIRLNPSLGFLGGTVARRAILEGYSVTSISRRGKPTDISTSDDTSSGSTEFNSKIDYRIGDARSKETITKILNEGNYKAVIHCIGLLFDGESGIGNLNKFVSGSGSIPDDMSSYDDITRKTAFNAIEAAEEYSKRNRRGGEPLPFIFTSAAEAGWPDVGGGNLVESYLAPDWLKRYLVAKRSVESRLMDDSNSKEGLLRPVIFRPSLIFSFDRIASLPPVGAFFIGNKLGLPFVDRPVTVQALSAAVVKSLSDPNVRGVQRFMQIDELSK